MRIIQLPSSRRHMKGAGIGNLFAKLTTFVRPLLKTAFRAARPIAKKTIKQIGREGVNAAGNTLSDVLMKKTAPKEAIKKNMKKTVNTAKQGAKRALSAAISEVGKDIKRRKLTGSGIKLKNKQGKQKKSKPKKKKKTKRRKPYRGIFQ